MGKTLLADIPGNRFIETHLVPAITGSNVKEVPVTVAQNALSMKKISAVPQAAITGNDTNNFGVRIKNKALDGSGVVVLASLIFVAGVDGVAFDEKSLGTISNAAVAKDEVLSYEKFVAGSGLNMPDMLLVLEYELT